MITIPSFNSFSPYIFFIVVFTIIFVAAVREFLTWYWKINKIIDLLEDIKGNTSKDIKREEIKSPKF